MTILTIEIPDKTVEDVINFLKTKDVVIKKEQIKNLEDLTADDYRKNFIHRAGKTREITSKHI